MTAGRRITYALVSDALEAPERHGYIPGENQHATPASSSQPQPAPGKETGQ